MSDVPITRLLQVAASGDKSAADAVFSHVYVELHALAQKFMGKERSDHTLQPTALVNEVYLGLFKSAPMEWSDRRHFFHAAALAMRRILIDHARARKARPEGRSTSLTADLPESVFELADAPELVELIEEGLVQLGLVSGTCVGVVHLRFFVGLEEEEAAKTLGISRSTVQREWRYARAFLAKFIAARRSDGDASA